MKMKNAKYKMFKYKKGFNDISIIGILLFIFIGMGFIIPFINAEFNTSSPEFDTDNPARELIEENFEQPSDIKAGNILKSIGKMFFWTFGDLPTWLDIILIVLRITLIIVLARNFIPFLSGGG